MTGPEVKGRDERAGREVSQITLLAARPTEPVDLYSPAIDSDPFPLYEALRERYPAYWSSGGRFWILSRYDDVARAATDWQTFSSLQGNLVDEIPNRAGGTLGTTDPPRHDRLRALAQAAFTKKNLDYLVPVILGVAEPALDRIAAKGSFDFVGEFSAVVTVATIFRLLGLPERNPLAIRALVVKSVSTDKARKGRNAEFDAAFAELSGFVSEQVGIRRKEPRDDLITRLAEAEIDGDRLSEREVILTTSMFVVAGVESLSSFMSMLALNLTDWPDERAKIVADLALLPQAIEESLRFNTSAQRFKRTLTRDIEIHGQVMHAGDYVVLAYGAANRDPRKFTDPDRYDIGRKPQGHLGFGTGKHFCIGSQFSRLVSDVAMGAFLQRIPHFRRSNADLAWISSSNFRSPLSLPLQIANS